MRYLMVFFICAMGTLFPRNTSAQKNAKLFTKLNPEHTKIYFNNELKDTREANIILYSNFYGGGGVGIGDINNDGLQDIYFAGNLVGDKLYLNKGNMVPEDNFRRKSNMS